MTRFVGTLGVAAYCAASMLACKGDPPPPLPPIDSTPRKQTVQEIHPTPPTAMPADVWRAYDALPAPQKTKAALVDAMKRANDAAKHTPDPGMTKAENNTEYRLRVAPLIRPPTRATGEDAVILVPSPNLAECLVWASMWNKESADDLTEMGFEKLRCPNGKEWLIGMTK